MTEQEFFQLGRIAYTSSNIDDSLKATQKLSNVLQDANNFYILKIKVSAVCKDANEKQKELKISSKTILDTLIVKLSRLLL